MPGLVPLLPQVRVAIFAVLVAIMAGAMFVSTMRMLPTLRARLLFIGLFAAAFAGIAACYLFQP